MVILWGRFKEQNVTNEGDERRPLLLVLSHQIKDSQLKCGRMQVSQRRATPAGVSMALIVFILYNQSFD